MVIWHVVTGRRVLDKKCLTASDAIKLHHCHRESDARRALFQIARGAALLRSSTRNRGDALRVPAIDLDARASVWRGRVSVIGRLVMRKMSIYIPGNKAQNEYQRLSAMPIDMPPARLVTAEPGMSRKPRRS